MDGCIDATRETPHPLESGTLVLCTYRMPASHQAWLGNLWIGVVEEPDDDLATWNGKNSERDYCTTCQMTRVRYPFGVMHDKTSCLIPITREEALLPYPLLVMLFVGQQAGERLQGMQGFETHTDHRAVFLFL